MRIRPTAPETADINFLALERLDDLSQLRPFVAVCDELGEHIHDLDRAIPRASERYSIMWRGYQGSGTAALRGQEAQAPEVLEAREEVQALKDQLKILHNNAGIARAELLLAKAQLLERLRPAMQEQLGPPLEALVRGLECAGAIERLCGLAPGHAQGRQLATLLLGY